MKKLQEQNIIRKVGADKNIYELSFEAHYKIVSIHPWADGNGRMSRLIMNMIQYEGGVIPSIVKKENRTEYIQSLSQSQDAEDPAQQLCNELEIDPNAVQKHIEKLKAANVIKRHGGANGGHWEILI